MTVTGFTAATGVALLRRRVPEDDTAGASSLGSADLCTIFSPQSRCNWNLKTVQYRYLPTPALTDWSVSDTNWLPAPGRDGFPMARTRVVTNRHGSGCQRLRSWQVREHWHMTSHQRHGARSADRQTSCQTSPTVPVRSYQRHRTSGHTSDIVRQVTPATSYVRSYQRHHTSGHTSDIVRQVIPATSYVRSHQRHRTSGHTSDIIRQVTPATSYVRSYQRHRTSGHTSDIIRQVRPR